MGRMASRFLGIILVAGPFAPPEASEETKPPELIYSHWSKFCFDAICFIGMDIRSECGPVAGAVLIEKAGETKRTLRVTLPVRVSLERGVRMMVDQGRPVTGYFVSCFHNGCMADQEGGTELVEQLKQGQTLSLEGIDIANLPISVSLPLAGFAKAHGGPPNEIRVLEERVLTKKDFEQKQRDDEARKLRCDGAKPLT